MPPAELDIISRAVEKLPLPRRSHDPPELIAILARQGADLGWAELDAVIGECAFPDAVQRLPAALRLLVDRPGDFSELANAVICFCKRNAQELAVLGISEEVATLLRAGFLGHWNRFVGQCVRREREPFDVLIGGCVAGGDDRDHYLDDLRNAATCQGKSHLWVLTEKENEPVVAQEITWNQEGEPANTRRELGRVTLDQAAVKVLAAEAN